MKISSVFPLYTKFAPEVPVYCVTPNEGRTIHRYFTSSPFSPSGRETDFVRICVRPPTEAVKQFIELRLDPHPAWDRSRRYFASNAIEDGTRRVFVADMKPLLERMGL